MTVERIPIESRDQWLALRKQDVTASAVACLFQGSGLDTYMTPYKLFMLKTGQIEEESDEPKIDEDSITLSPMGRGSLLEDKGAEMLRMMRPAWIVSKGAHYYRDPAARIGATPDLLVNDPERGFGIVQLKNPERSIYYSDKWKQEDGSFQPPLDYAIQACQEADLTGASWAAVGTFVVGHKTLFRLFDIPIHAGLMARVRDIVAEFWQRVAENRPYAPDYGRDGELIAGLYADDDGSETDLSGNERVVQLVTQREALKAREADGSAAAKERKAIDAEVIHILGNAARGRLADGRLIEAKTVRRKGFTVEPTSFRSVKIKEARSA